MVTAAVKVTTERALAEGPRAEARFSAEAPFNTVVAAGR